MSAGRRKAPSAGRREASAHFLLDAEEPITGAGAVPVEQRDAARLAMQSARDKALAAFFAGNKGTAEFVQFVTKLMKAADEAKAVGLIDGLLPTRQTIIGVGIEAAWQAKRPAGRPAKEKPVDLFFHVWHMLNLEREVAGGSRHGRVPAKAIADYCLQYFPGAGEFTAKNVRAAVRAAALPPYLVAPEK